MCPVGAAILDFHFDRAVCIASINFLYPEVLHSQITSNCFARKIRRFTKTRIKGYPNLVPITNVAFRLIVRA